MTALAGNAIVSSGGVTPAWFSPQAGTHAHAASSTASAGAWARFIPSRSTWSGEIRLSVASLLESGLRRRKPRDRQPVWRARHVVEPDLVAELDGCRIAAVLATDAQL